MKTSFALTLSLMILALLPATTWAQAEHADHAEHAASATVMASIKGLHDITATNIMKTAEMLDEALYAYQPTDEVRPAGKILAHVANAQFFFCSSAKGEESPASENYEETATSKEAIVAALKAAFAYCDTVYASMTDEDGAAAKTFFGRETTGIGILSFNSAHNYEHYGNLVTYMRLNGLVPPSSM